MENCHSGLKAFAKNKPDVVAITFYNQTLTFEELYYRVNALANSLLKMGVQKGDHIALFMRNRLEMPEIYFAISSIGAVSLPVNYMMKGNNLVQLLNQSDAQYIFVEKELLNNFEEIRDKLHLIKPETTIIVDSSTDKYVDYRELLSNGSKEETRINVNFEDVISIMFSSGTTSQPKGIVVKQKSIVNRVLRAAIDWKLNYSSVVMVSVPMYHSVGHFYTMMLGLTGCSIVITREFDSRVALHLIEKHQVNHAFFVPTQYYWLLQEPAIDDYQLHSLELLVSGAAPLAKDFKKEIIEKFDCAFTEFFGSSETGIILTLHPEDVISKSGSLGQQVEYAEIRLVDEGGNDVKLGEDGEFVARGSWLFSGYYGLEKETKEAFLPGGWLKTGDMGKRDEEGYYYLCDRKKDMIISGGVNVYPRDIEEVILSHGAVADTAVIGVADEVWGEAVKAFIVLKPGEKLTQEDVFHYSNERLAKFQRIKMVEFVTSLPRNPSGKILKYELRKLPIK
ncbi:AMP-binding protein [Peribacillus frigoritolerans]|uniref:class I adenylate-forming enzyme family protein n=1 Tax=Peribacillus frigoritolerans TaxID=450367 RepID=UPI0021D149D7|nr:AMP-binding protein [Peribacillus frigoritolerans]MCU6598945.1 AMP-binding protein [Peribacillus frigoritolerans]